MRVLAVATTLCATLATQPGGCATTAKACGLDFAGITVAEGRAWDTVTTACDAQHRPRKHMLQAWIEYKPLDEFGEYARRATTWDIPGDDTDVGGKAVALTVSSPCLEGTYRTRAYTKGVGADGIPFEYEDTGWQKRLTADDCAGG